MHESASDVVLAAVALSASSFAGKAKGCAAQRAAGMRTCRTGKLRRMRPERDQWLLRSHAWFA